MSEPTHVATETPAAPAAGGRPRSGLLEWIWRGRALREARAFRVSLPTQEQVCLARALTALELADRAYDPVEPLRAGSSLALSLSLYREASYWALLCQDQTVTGTTLADLFERVPAEILEQAAGGGLPLADVKRALVERSFVETAALAAEDLPREALLARDFAHALVARKLAPERRVGRILLQRAVRTSAAAALLLLAVVGGLVGFRRLAQGPDLAQGKPWRASSTLEKCNTAQRYCASAHTDIFFHTVEEQEPWLEIDLGKPTAFSSVEVVNRGDCCPDRAIPLVIEVGNDQTSWREVARRKETFTTWHATFNPQTARYVRLRTLRRSILHLELVAVRAR